MKSNDFLHMHETFTDESNSVIKIEDLLNNIKSLSKEEQNMYLMQIYIQSEKQNDLYKEEIKVHEDYLKMREIKSKPKRKVVNVKKIKIEPKKVINDTINEYEDEISELIDFSLEEFENYIHSDEFIDINLDFYILGLLREIKVYNDIADEAYLSKDLSLIEDVKLSVEELNQKISFLKVFRDRQNINEDENKKYNIIFLETSSKRSYFMEDIVGDKEYYNSYAELLSSIEQGKPLSFKVFTNNDSLKGLMEARDIFGQTRIFFDKINDDTYVIINAIIKKEDKSAGYTNQLKLRYKNYVDHKNYILNNLNNEEFIIRQEKHYKDVQELFGFDNAKKMLKNKGGGI